MLEAIPSALGDEVRVAAATLWNWEQGRSRPHVPTRVLLVVIAKHPDPVEDVLRTASGIQYS